MPPGVEVTLGMFRGRQREEVERVAALCGVDPDDVLRYVGNAIDLPQFTRDRIEAARAANPEQGRSWVWSANVFARVAT